MFNDIATIPYRSALLRLSQSHFQKGIWAENELAPVVSALRIVMAERDACLGQVLTQFSTPPASPSILLIHAWSGLPGLGPWHNLDYLQLQRQALTYPYSTIATEATSCNSEVPPVLY